MSKKPKIEEFSYGALLGFSDVLLDIINALPNASEIKKSAKYQQAYQNYVKSVAKYFEAKDKYQERKDGDL